MFMKISAKELATKLNISAATVSMVFNNKPGISEKTRELVLKAAKEYGYESNKKIDNLKENSVIHFVIYKKHGHLVTDTSFFSFVIEGVNLQCQKFNCRHQITYVYNNDSLQSLLSSISKSENSGVILLATEMTSSDFDFSSKYDIPMVILDNHFDELYYDSILINNSQGAYLATKYLIENGHKKIGYLSSNVSIGNFVERKHGYYNALREHDLPTEHPYIYYLSPHGQKAYEEMNRYLASSKEVATAYFADNDTIASSALRSFKEHGIRVPEDVSIIGFDDMPFCQIIDPPLTTMYVPKQELGALAVDRLLSKIKAVKKETVKIQVATHLIERNSVKKLI